MESTLHTAFRGALPEAFSQHGQPASSSVLQCRPEVSRGRSHRSLARGTRSGPRCWLAGSRPDLGELYCWTRAGETLYQSLGECECDPRWFTGCKLREGERLAASCQRALRDTKLLRAYDESNSISLLCDFGFSGLSETSSCCQASHSLQVIFSPPPPSFESNGATRAPQSSALPAARILERGSGGTGQSASACGASTL